METHNRLLSILHIVTGTLALVTFALGSIIINTMYPFLLNEMSSSGEEGAMIFDLIFQIVRGVFIVVLVVIPIPSLIGGLALLNGRKWGMSLLLISGSLNLFNIPLGTALGVYTIWVYLENQKRAMLQ